MTLKTRLKKLEQLLKTEQIHKDCICFPADEPPLLELKAEIESAKAVLCPVHGVRFRDFGAAIYRVIWIPPHLTPQHWSWHSPQYIKAMKASFPPDRWPATRFQDADGTVRYVLKDGLEILRHDPEEVFDYETGELCGYTVISPEGVPRFVSADDLEIADRGPSSSDE